MTDPDDLNPALARFRALYGPGEVLSLRAPARINILGEHVDYVTYLPTASLPFGSRQHAMMMLFRPSGDGRIRGASMQEPFAPFEFSLRDESPPEPNGQSWETWLFDRPAPAPHWSNYVKGAAFYARWKYGAALNQGFSFLIDSAIPANSGASSSSALVVLAGAAIRKVNQVECDLETLARESAQAEWYMGTRGGALDHTAICLSRAGHIIHLKHRQAPVEWIPIPDEGYRWVAFFTHPAPKGSEVMLAYNERAAVSRLIIPALRNEPEEKLPEAMTLAELAIRLPQVFRECERMFPALVRERRGHRLKLRARFDHHVGEIDLVNTAIATLGSASVSADAQMRALGGMLNRSHESLRDKYEVSTPEVEALIEILWNDSAIYGARMMGGGFGGNVLGLAAAGEAREAIERVQEAYYRPRGRNAWKEGSVMVSTPGTGLSSLDLSTMNGG
jgi:galactokinase